jgi:hypothetical protein
VGSDPDRWWTALTGNPASASGHTALRVASASVRGACAFNVLFEVPHVTPGSHSAIAIAFDERDGSSTAYAPAAVTVR